MELMKTSESLKVQLAELEEALLQALAQSEGNILHNKAYVWVWDFASMSAYCLHVCSLSLPACTMSLISLFSPHIPSARLLESLNETESKSSFVGESLQEASELQVWTHSFTHTYLYLVFFHP